MSVCVCVGFDIFGCVFEVFVMCWCVYVLICKIWVSVCVGFVVCGCVYVWVCVCVAFVMCGFVYVWGC